MPDDLGFPQRSNDVNQTTSPHPTLPAAGGSASLPADPSRGPGAKSNHWRDALSRYDAGLSQVDSRRWKTQIENAPPSSLVAPAGGRGIAGVTVVQNPASTSGTPAGTAGAAAAKPKVPLTLDALVNEWQKLDQSITPRTLRLGQLADIWSRHQADRPKAIQTIKERLATAGFKGEALRVNRFIATFWVAKLFGMEVATLQPVTILRSLIPLLKRNSITQDWTIRQNLKGQALALWQRIQQNKPTAAWVAGRVTELRPARVAPPSRRAKPPKLHVLSRLERLSADDLNEVIRHCQLRLQSLAGGNAAKVA